MELSKHRARLLLLSLLITFLIVRTLLFFSPNTDFSVGNYNIHHLFIGLILITLGGVPLILSKGNAPILNLATISFGVGLALALDEWVYLIATDGSNESYLLPVSFWGALTTVGFACLYIMLIYLYSTARQDA